MNIARFVVLFTIVLLSCACAHQAGGELTSFGWMIGEWSTEDGRVSEHWHAISGKAFEGRGATYFDDKISTESMRLVHMEGQIFYLAKVAHNDLPAAFRLTDESTPGHSVFVNPDHDFPRQLVYEKNGPEGMVVTVGDGGPDGFQLRFSRR